MECANATPRKPIDGEGRVIPMRKRIETGEMGMREPAAAAARDVAPIAKTEPAPRIIVVGQPTIGLPAPPVIRHFVPITIGGEVTVNLAIVGGQGG